jgi:hypothetical protein
MDMWVYIHADHGFGSDDSKSIVRREAIRSFMGPQNYFTATDDGCHENKSLNSGPRNPKKKAPRLPVFSHMGTRAKHRICVHIISVHR